jgi:hypothetical protein
MASPHGVSIDVQNWTLSDNENWTPGLK